MTTHQTASESSVTAREAGAVLRVSEVKARYFGGKMSLRWWYRQIELGRLPHVRAGGSILVRKVDADAFAEAAYRQDAPTPAATSVANEPAVRKPPKTALPRVAGGLRFFRD